MRLRLDARGWRIYGQLSGRNDLGLDHGRRARQLRGRVDGRRPVRRGATLHTQTTPVCVGVTYTFHIFDSYGDGICAYGEGAYLQLNGVEMVRGGEFAGLETYAFTPTATHGGVDSYSLLRTRTRTRVPSLT